MPGIRFVTDSSCDLPQDLVDRHGIVVVPLTIRFGDQEFVDREELSADDFYRRMAESQALPETAAPAPGAFEAAYRRLAGEGADTVIAITLSSSLSATMASAENAARAVTGDIDARVIDSRSITMGLGSQLIAAAEAAADGASADDVVALVEGLRERTNVFGALDTLDNLKKGGRIGGAQALLGSMLSIKPIIDISTGEVHEAGKQRTRAKAMRWLRDKLFEAGEVERLSVLHGAAPDIDEFVALIEERYPRSEFTLGTIGPVIGTHGGPRVLGLCWQTPA